MRRAIRSLAAVALAGLALGLGGCAENGGMGAKMDVWGYVASAESAQLEVDQNQPGGESIVVSRVLSPDDAWLVVHAEVDGAPGERVGLASIPAGESTGVEVELEGVTTDNVIVAVHADKGEPGEFDFDMMKPTMSPDRPYFVERAELARVIAVR